jgi:hypothetical protein
VIRKILKWIAIAVALVFVGIQFVRPQMTNAAVDESRTVGARLRVTPEVNAILARSCNDCHTQQTRFPWYSRVAPISWMLDDHIREGREHLDFSNWAAYDAEEQDLLLQNVCRLSRRGAMPLPSYLYIHRDAKLSEADAKTLCDWTNAERARLEAK